MIDTTNLKNGTVFMYYEKPYRVLQYEHIKMGRNGAVVKVKSRDLIYGAIKELSFSNNERVEEANVENRNLQYLYSDERNLYFMDSISFEQIEMPISRAEYEKKFLVEGKEFQITFFENTPLEILLSPRMFYKVAEAPSAVKGNTSTNALKYVKLENGLEIQAPQFIKAGDVVKINTTSCSYVSRGS